MNQSTFIHRHRRPGTRPWLAPTPENIFLLGFVGGTAITAITVMLVRLFL